MRSTTRLDYQYLALKLLNSHDYTNMVQARSFLLALLTSSREQRYSFKNTASWEIVMKGLYDTGPLRGFKGYADGDSGVKSFNEYVYRLAQMNAERPAEKRFEILMDESVAIADYKERLARKIESVEANKVAKQVRDEMNADGWVYWQMELFMVSPCDMMRILYLLKTMLRTILLVVIIVVNLSENVKGNGL